MKDDYGDMIDMPHHVSLRHPQAAMEARAAQFAPFAALTGYYDVIEETARLTDESAELDEESISELNDKIVYLCARLKDAPEITVTFFRPDEKKAGGSYLSVTGTVKRVDELEHRLIMDDGRSIAMGFITGIDGEIFEGFPGAGQPI